MEPLEPYVLAPRSRGARLSPTRALLRCASPVALELDALLDGPVLEGAGRAAQRAFLASLPVRRHPLGDLLFFEGQPGDSLLLVARGEVAVTRRSLAGETVELGRAGPGDFVGEVSLVAGGPRGATVVSTHADTVVLELGSSRLAASLAAGDEAARALVRATTRRLAQRVRTLDARIEVVRDALAGEAPARVDAGLAQLGHAPRGPADWRRELLPFFASSG